MKCPKCGEEVTEGAAFCWACEAPLDNLRLPPTAAGPPRADLQETTRSSQSGKTQEILAFAVFMMGVLWSCGTTAASQDASFTDYIWPLVLVAAGIVIYIHGRFKGRSPAAK
jgi:hypothetical protein